jgi:hypothetical protein
VSLLGVIVLLVALSIWGQYLRYFQRFVDIRAWMEFVLDLLNHKFYLDAESNIPTWFNTVLLVVISALFWLIGMIRLAEGGKFRFHWLGLAVLFLIMSIDELSILHEMLIQPIRERLGLGGWFYFGWVIPALALLAVLALAYVRFYLHLEHRFKWLFLVSFVTYFSGAIGGEMLSGRIASAIGQRNFTYAVYASLEESVEMIGASLIIFTLLRYFEVAIPEVWLVARSKSGNRDLGNTGGAQ